MRVAKTGTATLVPKSDRRKLGRNRDGRARRMVAPRPIHALRAAGLTPGFWQGAVSLITSDGLEELDRRVLKERREYLYYWRTFQVMDKLFRAFVWNNHLWGKVGRANVRRFAVEVAILVAYSMRRYLDGDSFVRKAPSLRAPYRGRAQS